MPDVMLIVIGVTIAIGALATVGTRVYETRRRRALEQAAADLGWTYARGGDAALEPVRRSLRLFSRGRHPTATNLISGRIEDLEFFLFDYAYTTGGGKSKARHRQTVAAVRRPDSPLPAFELRPEGLLSKVVEMLGGQDIDLPEHPAFSKRYALTGPHEAAIRAVFTPEAVRFFEAKPKGLAVEAEGEWLIVFRAGRRVAPANLPALLEEAFEVAAHLGTHGSSVSA